MGDDDLVEPWRSVLLAQAAALQAIERDLKRKGLLPLRWYDVLLELNAAEGRRLRMSDLSERVVLSRTRVSRTVDELVGAGLVERIANPDDRRSSLARITRDGRARLRATAPHYIAGIGEHFSALLQPTERRVITSALQRVADHHRVAMAGSRR